MSDRNFVLLEGTVCSEPKLKDTPKSRLLMFRVATQREGMKFPERNNVKAWGDQPRVSEGDRVEVRGILKTEKYGDEDNPKFWTGCVADTIRVLGAAGPDEDDDDLPF